MSSSEIRRTNLDIIKERGQISPLLTYREDGNTFLLGIYSQYVILIWLTLIFYREGLMSYKQFMQELEDDVLPVEAQRRCVTLNRFSW